MMKLMGKRQIGELEPSELVVTIIISEVAAMPIQDTSQPVILSVVAIVLLLILEVIISLAKIKGRSFTDLSDIRTQKAHDKGGFSKKILLIAVHED